MSRDTLPDDFFDWLSLKKEGLLKVLLDAEEEWVIGYEVRRRMRTNHGLSVPEKSGAISSHQGHLTKRYSKEFSRDIINVQWADDNQVNAEYRIGEKYEDELREYFDR